MQYNRMRVAVGLFIISLFFGILTFLYLILEEKGTFEERFNYYFYTDSASSFHIGMPLKFSGFNIGVIDKISLEDKGVVKMTFSVSQTNKKWLSRDTTLLLKKPLIGASYIEVITKNSSGIIEDGKVFKFMMSDDINDMITKLKPAVDNIVNIIDNLDKISKRLASDDSDILQTLKNINKFSEKLLSDNSLLTTIIGDDKPTKDIIDTVRDIKNIIEDIKKITGNLDSKILNPTSSVIKELNIIMKDISSKLKAIDSTVKTVGKFDNDLIDLKDQLEVGLEKSNSIMDKMDMILTNNSDAKMELP